MSPGFVRCAALLLMVVLPGLASAAVPTAPADLDAATSGASVKLKWTDPVGESQIKVERKADGGSYSEIASLSGGTTQYTDTAVTLVSVVGEARLSC